MGLSRAQLEVSLSSTPSLALTLTPQLTTRKLQLHLSKQNQTLTRDYLNLISSVSNLPFILA